MPQHNDAMTFQEAEVVLFKEAFEGIAKGASGTWFVEGKEGLFNAFESVDAAQASQHANDKSYSIAAHAYHILYLLRVANYNQGFPAPEGSWNDSWKNQEATAEEWNDLVEEIRLNYERVLQFLSGNQDWSNDETVIGALAVLPHVAFHLGAIRQLLRLV